MRDEVRLRWDSGDRWVCGHYALQPERSASRCAHVEDELAAEGALLATHAGHDIYAASAPDQQVAVPVSRACASEDAAVFGVGGDWPGGSFNTPKLPSGI